MSEMSNVYYSPEDFGLVPFAELELSEPDYSFDILMVWRHTETDTLLWMSDSGCSCPSPFKDYTSIDDLPELATDLDYRYLEEIAKTADNKNNMRTFLRKVRRAMPKG